MKKIKKYYHIYNFKEKKEEMTIIKNYNKDTNFDGWFYECFFCYIKCSRIETINNDEGTLKSFVCKDCKGKKTYHTYQNFYYKYIENNNLDNII